ncbi:MAG: hypothetical protein A3A33_04360 [Candidatus Yanofskybacteria bacterium RIFCSPLOWO2_01_FULL_49_25]|uniref:DUF5671 domain-containing protein n=1 Tax=Candidatus Yanofskybacteria bacterium RIFCSPLOWO2_01_FULL_49_25 TaxID=1802701 RepID=A0A1F8GWC1_9BACT|nr:MAG: hypothetical protein A3A33_04360 [Candidatus Yanofskybacteria bacterium RIFCSPLOWO2_01_FULL_49_25]
MESQIKTGPKEFFLHLLTFGLLYVFAVSFIGLWWQIINIKFPDLLVYYSIGFDQLRWPISILIVVFPIYVVLARMTTQAIIADPNKKDLRIYRWLVYLTLFATAVTVIVDLISLLYNFLGGELTTRFGLKVFVVLIVSLGIFGYYLWHLRSNVSQTRASRRMILWSSLAVVVVSIVFAFVIVGSPATARAQRFDQQRIGDLQNIEWQIMSYWQTEHALPTSLNELSNSMTGFVLPRDPKTQEPYEYRILSHQTASPQQFELCAMFSTKMERDIYTDRFGPRSTPSKEGTWNHNIGRNCFSRTVDSSLYQKPVPIPIY